MLQCHVSSSGVPAGLASANPLPHEYWGNDYSAAKVIGPLVATGTVGDYGGDNNFKMYPSSKKDLTLCYERRLGGNFSFGAMTAAMGLDLDDALFAGQYFNVFSKDVRYRGRLHPQIEQDAIEDGFYYFYQVHPEYKAIDGFSPPAGYVSHLVAHHGRMIG